MINFDTSSNLCLIDLGVEGSGLEWREAFETARETIKSQSREGPQAHQVRVRGGGAPLDKGQVPGTHLTGSEHLTPTPQPAVAAHALLAAAL